MPLSEILVNEVFPLTTMLMFILYIMQIMFNSASDNLTHADVVNYLRYINSCLINIRG